jgi:glycosyltransferase involved in cell wall biosynthesis
MEPKLSVVVCVFNEAPNIRQLVTEISSVLETYEYELIYVDDGSTDATLKILKSIQNDQLTIIEFRKNYGQSSALAAGIELARGDYIVTMDGDLQNDPHDIPEMLLLAEQGQWDLVAGIRVNRKDGTILRKWPSKIANFVIQRSSGVKIADYGCTLRVFKSDIAKDIGLYGQLHRFIPLLAHLEGARITQMPVNHRARTAGTS